MPSTATSPRPTVDATSSRPRRRRDPLFDNAKIVLVTLVVVGHGWAVLPRTPATSWAYDFLYLWHVPAFVLVTGYLSRSFAYTRRHLVRLVTTVAVPYVLFEGLLALFRTDVGGENLPGTLWWDPHWLMWYLSALFLWRLATPLLIRLPFALPVAVAVSLAGGLTSGHALDVQRAMSLLPFFVLGLRARPEHLALLQRPAVRLAAVVPVAGALAWAPYIGATIGHDWLYWRDGYAGMGLSVAGGLEVRALHLLISAVLSVAFLALLPHDRHWFTRLGAASLVVYLCHGFVMKGVDYAGFAGWAHVHPVRALVAVPAFAVPLALLLAWPPVADRLALVVNPVETWRRRLRQGG